LHRSRRRGRPEFSYSVNNQRRHDEGVARVLADPQLHASVLYGINGRVWQLKDAVSKQRERIFAQEFFDSHPDIEIATVLLRDVARMAELLVELGCEVEASLAKFDDSSPDLRKARNVLSHLEDYMIGAGQMETDPITAEEPWTMAYGRGSEEEGGAIVIFATAGFIVNIGPALLAGVVLCDELIEAADIKIRSLRN